MATNNRILKALASPYVAGVLISLCAFTMCANDAMAGRGGGGRGGGGGARGGGGGGRMAQSSVSGGNRSASRSASSSRGGGDRGNSGGRSGGDRGSGDRGGDRGGGDRSVERNGGDRTRTSGDRTNNIGSNNNVNIEGRDVNVNVDGGYGCCYGGGFRHPIAAGVTIGAIATSVAVAAGSYYYALPSSGCVTVVRNGASYYQCGSAYYQEAMDGDEVVYVSVNSP